MAKDKKKKVKKKDKAAAASGKKARGRTAATGTARLKKLTENPLVADVVAAALVSTAAALKDSKTARRLAAQVGDELGDLAKEGADKGSALWQLAIEVGRRSLEALASEAAAAPRKAKARKGADS